MKEKEIEGKDLLEKTLQKKKIPKEVSQEILRKILKNLILAIVVMIYFIVSNICYTKFDTEQMERIIQLFSGGFLLAGLIMLEIAYKKESGSLTIIAIELFVLCIHALFINHITIVYNFDFRIYLLTSSYIFAIYYVLKSIIIYTKARMKYLKSLSDIPEILKDEPIIKEAKKRNKEEDVLDSKINDNEEMKKVIKETKPKSIRVKNRKKADKVGTTNNKKSAEKKKTQNKSTDIKKDEKVKTTKKRSSKNTTKKKIQKKTAKKDEINDDKEIKLEKNKEDKKTNKVEGKIEKQQKTKSKKGRKKKEEVTKND